MIGNGSVLSVLHFCLESPDGGICAFGVSFLEVGSLACVP